MVSDGPQGLRAQPVDAEAGGEAHVEPGQPRPQLVQGDVDTGRVDLELPATADSTLHEWLTDPEGQAMLGELDVVLLRDPELVKVVGTMPMRTLASFDGMVVDHDVLDELVAKIS